MDICHPVVAAEIRQKIAKQMAERVDEAFLKYVMNGAYHGSRFYQPSMRSIPWLMSFTDRFDFGGIMGC